MIKKKIIFLNITITFLENYDKLLENKIINLIIISDFYDCTYAYRTYKLI